MVRCEQPAAKTHAAIEWTRKNPRGGDGEILSSCEFRGQAYCSDRAHRRRHDRPVCVHRTVACTPRESTRRPISAVVITPTSACAGNAATSRDVRCEQSNDRDGRVRIPVGVRKTGSKFGAKATNLSREVSAGKRTCSPRRRHVVPTKGAAPNISFLEMARWRGSHTTVTRFARFSKVVCR